MFWLFNKYHRSEEEVIEHNGVFKKRINLFQAVALIVTFTIGAGIFSLPYAISQVGLLVGIIYLVLLGILIMGMNLMLGQVADKAGDNMQLVGLAKKYLGKKGEFVMTFLFYLISFGVLVIYLIGEGNALSALLPGTKFMWSIIFFVFGSLLVLFSIRVIKVISFVLSLSILFIILLIVWTSAPHINYQNYVYTDFRNLFLPFGVILFAYSSLTSIPEAHSLLKNKSKDFKKSIVLSSLIVMSAYILFVLAVLGVTGVDTTEIATIALGQKVGPTIYFLGNIFAVLTMGTGFLMSGIALKDSLVWDYKISSALAIFITLLIPLILFVLGVRQFVTAIGVVGGVVVSSQMLLTVLIYWRAKQMGHLNSNKYQMHHIFLLMIPLTIVLVLGVIYSTVKLFF
ncbi:MAG: aromatic amino acid transport family protein [Candidatus Magasanikbacteria bacterium]